MLARINLNICNTSQSMHTRFVVVVSFCSLLVNLYWFDLLALCVLQYIMRYIAPICAWLRSEVTDVPSSGFQSAAAAIPNKEIGDKTSMCPPALSPNAFPYRKQMFFPFVYVSNLKLLLPAQINAVFFKLKEEFVRIV